MISHIVQYRDVVRTPMGQENQASKGPPSNYHNMEICERLKRRQTLDLIAK